MTSTTTTTTTTTTSIPPVTLPPSTHLDPRAYVRGHHGITLGEHVVIHPRAHLIAIHGPLFIADKSIVGENCVIGGPVPAAASGGTSSTSAATAAAATPGLQASSSSRAAGADSLDDDQEPDPVKTMIGSNVHLQSNVHVLAGAKVHDAAILESNVVVLAGVTVGAHSKITAATTVDHDVPDWTVVLGDGSRRTRRQNSTPLRDDGGRDSVKGTESPAETVERIRLKAMDKEREGTLVMLRMAQRGATAARKK